VNAFRELWAKFRSKKYREEFVAAQVKRAIPFQIRALMKKKGMSQEKLAELSGLTQGVISRAANPNYGNLTLNTLVRIAAGFDMAFIGRFVPFSELGRYFVKLDEDSIDVPTYTEEDEEIQALVRLEEFGLEQSEIANLLKRIQQVQSQIQSQETKRLIEQIAEELAQLARGWGTEKLQAQTANGGMRKVPGRILEMPTPSGRVISQMPASA
jgi:transcriptional regulator with XRE-family HTH domain